MNKNFTTSPMRIVLLTLLLLFSFGFPPLMLLSVPLFGREAYLIAKRVRFLRRSRQAYYEERGIVAYGKHFGGGR